MSNNTRMIYIKLKEGVKIPNYETVGASGMDVVANSILKVFKGDKEVSEERLKKIQSSFNERGYIKMHAAERILFGTGITISDMPFDMEIQVRSRSGVTLKRGLIVGNSPGTVDSDYRGEIGIIIINTTNCLNKVEKRERIAQLVPSLVKRIEFKESTLNTTTERGLGGFGSTGN